MKTRKKGFSREADSSKVLTTNATLLPATSVDNPQPHKPYSPRGCQMSPGSPQLPSPCSGAVKSYGCSGQGCLLTQGRAGETATQKRSC